MPELSRFYGIVIKMYFEDHYPPHFHAEYADDSAIISIETLAVIEGRLRPRAMGLVAEWASMHQEDLRNAWNQARNLENPEKIPPLS